MIVLSPKEHDTLTGLAFYAVNTRGTIEKLKIQVEHWKAKFEESHGKLVKLYEETKHFRVALRSSPEKIKNLIVEILRSDTNERIKEVEELSPYRSDVKLKEKNRNFTKY